jgi:phage terminase large subunit
VVNLALFRKHVQDKSPAFVPLFKNKKRYEIVWGGAGSGKSHIVARKLLYRILKESHIKHNFLIIRKVDRTIKRSVFALMKNIISRWGMQSEFDINLTDKTLTYKLNGSQIMFSGLDDAEKLKSIEGVTSIWCEEATELTQDDFEQLDLRLRGNTGALKQITFFDDPIQGVFTLKTTYLDNSFIDDDYKTVMENKKKTNPRFYNIYCLGNWGTADGLIFSNVNARMIRPEEVAGLEYVQGLDFGYTNDPSAFNQTYIDMKNKKIYVYDGFYQKGMSNAEIAESIKSMQGHKRVTTADSSEPKSIDYISKKGVNIRGAMKGAGSISTGLDFLLEFEIIVNTHLIEFMVEFNNYCWGVDKNGKATNKPTDDFNHFIDSLRYACEHHTRNSGFVFAC